MTESEMTGSGSDRRGFMKGAAVTAAAVGAGALAQVENPDMATAEESDTATEASTGPHAEGDPEAVRP